MKEWRPEERINKQVNIKDFFHFLIALKENWLFKEKNKKYYDALHNTQK